MKNHLEAISLLAAEHKDREIGEYLNEITSQIRLSDDTIFTGNSGIDCKCQRKSEPGAHEKVSHKRPRKSEPERSRIVDPVC